MADRKQLDASKIDSLYSWIAYDLQKLKTEILNEVKYSSVQLTALHKDLKNNEEKNAAASAQSAQAISQEIRYSYKQNQTIYDGIATMLTDKVGTAVEDIKATIEVLKARLEALGDLDADTLTETVNEIKYSYLQHQAIYDGLTTLISGDVMGKLNDVEEKLAFVERIDKTLDEINARVAESVALFENAEYKTLVESIAEKTEESLLEHSRQILGAVATIPVAENVDYSRIADEVGDKMLEVLGEVVAQESTPEIKPVNTGIDYDKIIYGTMEKVVESLPYPEKIDYRYIDERFEKAAQNVQVTVAEEVIAKAVSTAVAQAMATIDINAIADAVVEKLQRPVEQPEIDYELLSDMVVAKLTENAKQSREVTLDETGIEQIVEKVTQKIGQVEGVDYNRIEAIVAEKTTKEDPTYELVIDEEGMEAIAERVSLRICDMCAECAIEEEQQTEEERVVEESSTEETQKSKTVEEELAISDVSSVQEIDDQLVDAETGLVIRLKKSFTAKLKQSEESVKGYYSDIKNALTSYKKINSNVSWHGDRFNFGRDTVAKMAICGKTLCLYLALDPENPEFKQTVYHQKNVGDQRAHESTPFMVKIKSNAAAKKAVRLVTYLAEAKGAVAKEHFETVDYVEEFAYASTKQLFEEGYIKVTKEKKVEFNF